MCRLLKTQGNQTCQHMYMQNHIISTFQSITILAPSKAWIIRALWIKEIKVWRHNLIWIIISMLMNSCLKARKACHQTAKALPAVTKKWLREVPCQQTIMIWITNFWQKVSTNKTLTKNHSWSKKTGFIKTESLQALLGTTINSLIKHLEFKISTKNKVWNEEIEINI